ncbi:MAG: hypothetical protein AABZ33_01490 [Chloroflexota bacterium]
MSSGPPSGDTAAFPVSGAAVDLGSNSVHLLIAGIGSDQSLDPLVDESVFLGLGDKVAADSRLGGTVRAAVVDTLIDYARIARDLGAASTTFVGTEPIRRAGDAATLARDVEAATGLALHVLNHEEEAYLTVIGVTSGRRIGRETLIVDIGGGSSEFCIVGPTKPPHAVGLRLGGASLTARHVSADPPTRDEVEAMVVEARTSLDAAPESATLEIVAVGGTASNLLKLVPEAMSGILTTETVAEARRILERETAAQVAARYSMKPVRARLLPAGVAIMEALLTRYGVEEIRVSEAGIREGAILAVDQAGGAWRDLLLELAHGWRA